MGSRLRLSVPLVDMGAVILCPSLYLFALPLALAVAIAVAGQLSLLSLS